MRISLHKVFSKLHIVCFQAPDITRNDKMLHQCLSGMCIPSNTTQVGMCQCGKGW